MKKFDRVTGHFNPKNIDNVRVEAKPFVGKLMTFEVLWKIDENDGVEQYVGQWAMAPVAEHRDWASECCCWVAEEDIDIVAYPNI